MPVRHDPDQLSEAVLLICHACERRILNENPDRYRKSWPYHQPKVRLRTKSFRAAIAFKDQHFEHGRTDEPMGIPIL